MFPALAARASQGGLDSSSGRPAAVLREDFHGPTTPVSSPRAREVLRPTLDDGGAAQPERGGRPPQRGSSRGFKSASRACQAPRRGTGTALGPAGRVLCAARTGGASRNSPRELRSLRSDKRAESVHEARCARRPSPALLGAAHGPRRGPVSRDSRGGGLAGKQTDGGSLVERVASTAHRGRVGARGPLGGLPASLTRTNGPVRLRSFSCSGRVLYRPQRDAARHVASDCCRCTADLARRVRHNGFCA
jgi:hypothetical protein